ncbi:hypothetical protein F4808DRAFT_462354 [Astrocystis sublimbata]|nr:hypothetical protein F4808DRAFT_462354 [Astrocystis sublimbata]
MRTAIPTFLAVLAGVARSQPIDLIVEKFTCGTYVNTTVNWDPLDMDLKDPKVLSKVSALYINQEVGGSAYTFFCFAHGPNGESYNREAFDFEHPLRLSTGNNVVVQYIECLTE